MASAPTAAKVNYNIETPEEFAKSLLAYNGWPETQSNINYLVAWEAAEGGNWNNTAAYNPLNTTLQTSGSANTTIDTGNGVYVQSYPTWQAGIQATSQTLNSGQYNAIVSALQNGNASSSFASSSAMTSQISQWGTNVSTIGTVLGTPGAVAQYGATTSSTSAPGSAADSGSLMGACNKQQCIIKIPLLVTSTCGLDQCQARALVSGLIVLAGAVTLLVGVAVLASSSKAGKGLAKLAPVGAGVNLLAKSTGGHVTERQAQRREATAHARGQREGRTMAEKGSTTSESYTPTPDDLDFAPA